jgi:glycosyltransferase involved in cell wall biosynthesis
MTKTPRLSICIPTYNRAELLESALAALAPQVRELGGEVELVVSDNCSADRTAEVVARAGGECPVRYHRNAENVGVIRNVLGVVRDHARGEFCWVMGDDDMVRAGGVRAVLEAIKAHPDLDYFYVNYSIDSFERRRGVFVTAEDFSEWTRTGNENQREGRVGRWEELLARDYGALTPIYCSVFRRATWLEGAGGLKISADPADGVLFSSVDETFPHSLVFARTMMGKPAWESGYPWVVMCGKESWADFIPAVVLLRFHELLDEYVARGAAARLVEQHRRRLLGYAGEPLTRILQGERLPRLESFSAARFLLRHWRYAEAWRAAYGAALTATVEQVGRRAPALVPFAVAARLHLRLARGWARLRARRASPGRPPRTHES